MDQIYKIASRAQKHEEFLDDLYNNDNGFAKTFTRDQLGEMSALLRSTLL